MSVRDRRDDDEVAHATQQVLSETARVLTYLDDLVDRGKNLVGVPGGEGVDDLVQESLWGVEHDGRRIIKKKMTVSSTAEKLIEHRKAISHRPTTGTHHQRQDGMVDVDPLLAA
ncbi:hypothetical protein G6F52_013867 [Rhizopus delemar]|nr:hypothetical protein G6F52_013867 [Rhizopus delemar]